MKLEAQNGPISEPNVVLVNDSDVEIGLVGKTGCHATPSQLHRAFSIFIFDNQRRLILQQRQAEKMTWPGHWSNTCCSHAVPGEQLLTSASRRLLDELGFTCALRHLFTFQYQAVYNDSCGENEIDHVFAGAYTGPLVPNCAEVSAVRFVEPRELLLDIQLSPQKYTPWLRLSLPRVLQMCTTVCTHSRDTAESSTGQQC